MAEVVDSPVPVLRHTALRCSLSFSHILRSLHLSLVPKWYHSVRPIGSGRSAARGLAHVGLRNFHLLASSGWNHDTNPLSFAPLPDGPKCFGRKDASYGRIRTRSCLANGQSTYSVAVKSRRSYEIRS